MRKGVQLWLIGQMNQDGSAADTRQNAHGVDLNRNFLDLNRNFPYRWEPITDPTYYSGPHPASEPETRAAMRLILRITASLWQNHRLRRSTAFVVELPAGPVDAGALTRHVRAVGAMERGERAGSRTSCAP